mgnify:CR=1 FL=1
MPEVNYEDLPEEFKTEQEKEADKQKNKDEKESK